MEDQDLTPMMRQYHAVKQETPDALLLFRLGDCASGRLFRSLSGSRHGGEGIRGQCAAAY